jgi:hypothetical protein
MSQANWAKKVLAPSVGLDLCQVFERLEKEFPAGLDYRLGDTPDDSSPFTGQEEAIRTCIPESVVKNVQDQFQLSADAAQLALHQLIVAVYDLNSGDGTYPSPFQVKLTTNLIRRDKLIKALPDLEQVKKKLSDITDSERQVDA